MVLMILIRLLVRTVVREAETFIISQVIIVMAFNTCEFLRSGFRWGGSTSIGRWGVVTVAFTAAFDRLKRFWTISNVRWLYASSTHVLEAFVAAMTVKFFMPFKLISTHCGITEARMTVGDVGWTVIEMEADVVF